MFTTKEIINKTGVKPSVLAYLTREGKLPCERRGKGISTLYKEETVDLINNFLLKTGRQIRSINIEGEENGAERAS